MLLLREDSRASTKTPRNWLGRRELAERAEEGLC